MQRILVAIDGSTSAALALDFAIELAAEHQAALIITYVVPIADPDHVWEDEGGIPVDDVRAVPPRPGDPCRRGG